MKTLYLVRHAKSSWKDPNLRDRDRPLNKRGKRDAPRVAEYISSKIDCPQAFISSPSRRTQDTAISFLHAFGQVMTRFETKEDLFHGDESDIEEAICSLDDKHQTAMLFLHNPGITDYVNELTESDIFNIPTCGVIGIQLDTDDWKAIKTCDAKKLFYHYPKSIA